MQIIQYQIINTCGTSTLTTPARSNKELSDLLTKLGNAKSKEEIPKDEYNVIYKHWETLIDEWSDYDVDKVKKKSAELNSLTKWQEERCVDNDSCYCYLLHTDTLLGEMAAQLLEEWLTKNGYQGVELVCLEGLNTLNIESYESGLSFFARWTFDKIKPNAMQMRYIFNIAGGFKSVSGFAQILGQFLADETIYIFESGKEILSMPKLPVRWEEKESIAKYLNDYRKISIGLALDSYTHLNSLWVKNGRFSPWGQLAWENAKQELYEKEVYPFIYDDVKEGKGFRKSVEGLDKTRIKNLNERIDDLCIYMISGRQKNVKRLDYKKLKGKNECSHECDAWSDLDAKRLFCNEENGEIIVEYLGEALH